MKVFSNLFLCYIIPPHDFYETLGHKNALADSMRVQPIDIFYIIQWIFIKINKLYKNNLIL